MPIYRFVIIFWLASEKIILCLKEDHITNASNARNISTDDEKYNGQYYIS